MSFICLKKISYGRHMFSYVGKNFEKWSMLHVVWKHMLDESYHSVNIWKHMLSEIVDYSRHMKIIQQTYFQKSSYMLVIWNEYDKNILTYVCSMINI